MSGGVEKAIGWFTSIGREPFEFQRETWAAYLAGKNGLVQTPTGSGKTLAVAIGPMIEAIDSENLSRSPGNPGEGRGEGNIGNTNGPHPDPLPDYRERGKKRGKKRQHFSEPLRLLWITPLRALASDTVESLKVALAGMGLDWTIELRTSDTSATVRKRQRERLPTILVTTPESISLLLSYPDASAKLSTIRCAVVDEWHELMGTKRGLQTELALARLRVLNPNMRTWGLSATIANTAEAASTLLGPAFSGEAAMISAPDDKQIEVESLLPATVERFPWAGHIGLKMVDAVANRIESAASTLVFTNTRAQSEIWFRALLKAKPEWLGKIAVHHGSIDRKIRQGIEQLLREGKLRAVVCTSSLDLGVDFWPVDQVMQIGSPKGVARTMQRAGRSGHRPGAVSRIICSPTQAIEMVEFSAARWAIERRRVEARTPLKLALDVLAQHVITIAAGGGFLEKELFDEVRSTHAYAALTQEQWQWVIDFAQRGGPSLIAYPRFTRIVEQEGRWVAASDQLSKMHRMGIGTITSDGSVNVQYVSGKYLGSVEESFAAKLRPGDTFAFAGKVLEFVRLHEMNAQVRVGKKKSGLVPRWNGSRLPFSESLSDAIRMRLDEAAREEYADVEMKYVRPILELQRRWSVIPREHEVLVEMVKTRDGYHQFIFPLQGRLAHEGLAALLSYRFLRRHSTPITATFNDYGVELLSPTPLAENESDWREALSPTNLIEDVLACLNTGELAKRHFREIARIAGLLVPARPGAHRSTRQLQASSGLFYDVFREFDPGNLLLAQAQREVLERQLEFARLQHALERIATEQLIISKPSRISPLAFPLLAERLQSQQVRSESGSERIERLAQQLEKAADSGAGK